MFHPGLRSFSSPIEAKEEPLYLIKPLHKHDRIHKETKYSWAEHDS